MLDPYTYRCPAGHPDPCPVCTGAPHLEEILQYEGAHTVAAVILETVVGTNGIIVPPDGYLQSIRETCDRHGILLICDEVMAGFGRTGKWFAVRPLGRRPRHPHGREGHQLRLRAARRDGRLASRSPTGCATSFFAGGLTYCGHPLACAVGRRLDRGVPGGGDRRERGRARATYLAEALPALAEKHPSIGDVRGLGSSGGSSSSRSARRASRSSPSTRGGEAAAPVARLRRRRSSAAST